MNLRTFHSIYPPASHPERAHQPGPARPAAQQGFLISHKIKSIPGEKQLPTW